MEGGDARMFLESRGVDVVDGVDRASAWWDGAQRCPN